MLILDKKLIQTSKKMSIKPIERLGIMLDRSLSLISVLYDCFVNGITYIPIDVNWPVERIQSIITNEQIERVITNINYSSKINNTEITIINDDSGLIFENYNFNNEIAYILHTSGSSGVPKGVSITRESLLNFIDGISEKIDFSPQKRIACLTTFSFDIFFLESIMALYKDLTVIFGNEDEQRNPELMAKLIQDNDVDMIQMTPSRMQLMINHDKELTCLKKVKEIMIGGEPFPLSLLRTLQEKTSAKIYNMYGPTEATIWSTISDLTNKNRIDIGHPIKNTEIYIVNENLHILTEGKTGEICIAGKGLAKGYVGKEDLTAEKFIYLPQKPDTRVYRTGDLGKYLPDGDLEYLGRIDNQVKIRGHRIELEEIESYINQFNGIKQSVVIVMETSETDKILEAFYTSEINIDKKNIINFLSLKLPPYMIPAIFKRVDNFIQTSNGKIDRNRILECIEIKSDHAVYQEVSYDEMPEIQKKALEVIASNLNSKYLDDISLDSDFANIGIDSITFIKIVVALESEFDFEFDDEMLLITAFPTVKSIIQYVESKVGAD